MGTLAVNIVGSLILGVLAAAATPAVAVLVGTDRQVADALEGGDTGWSYRA